MIQKVYMIHLWIVHLLLKPFGNQLNDDDLPLDSTCDYFAPPNLNDVLTNFCQKWGPNIVQYMARLSLYSLP